MIINAIDPGPVQSALVVIDGARKVLSHDLRPNADVLGLVEDTEGAEHVVCEMIASYGMPVGAEVFETCVWIGRFEQACYPHVMHRIFRKDVKLEICGDPRAKDGNVRQALIDRYPATGGGRVPQIGTKKFPGPLYGMVKDKWAALGVAHAWLDIQERKSDD